VAGVDSSVSLAPNHPALQVTYLRGKPKGRVVSCFTQLSPSIQYKVHNSTINAIERAMKERLLFVKDKDTGEFIPTEKPTVSFSEANQKFFEQFSRCVTPVAPLGKDNFLAEYKGRRRNVYEKAFISLLRKPLRRSDSYVSFFIKCEKINFTSKADPVPRGISPRSPRYHVALGPYIRRIEKKVFKAIGEVFAHTAVFKGLNASDRATTLRKHWDSFDDPVALGLDASRFDQHVSSDALKYEHSVYQLYFPRDKKFAKLLSWQLVNHLYGRAADGTAKLKLNGGRMSGDMNTALGNCLIMCSLVYSYMSTLNIKFKLANDGDDCVIIVEKKHLGRLSTLPMYFLKLGFDMKVEEPVYRFEEIEFCQSQPIWTPQGWIMVRQVPTSIAKDAICIKTLNNPKLARRWVKAVGEGGLALTGGIPIVQELYKRYYDLGGDAKPLINDPTQETGLTLLGRGMKREYGPIHYLTRVSFWRAFGMCSAKQEIYEAVLSKVEIDLDAVSQWSLRPRLRL
jgi:hypothetical protein